ncbi:MULTISPECIES: glycerophosphoryl diester phosphodiesterase membrane domain-containing protein [Pedobacter]|uniref:glycerophosphoryl diester phosphodiesterase membrane domain-containing protein n=1 Tax=Pedobacter TaxID=84567 RepID=UPI0021096CCA|nr:MULTISPECIES: glycerophosphoryl diester phosphodiesterase membrane domain-containing protein [unclassified Pedobacter]
MQNKIEFKKARDFGEMIGDTFVFIKQNFKPLMRTLLYLTGFFFLAAILATMFQQLDMRKEVWGSGYMDPTNLSMGMAVKSLTAMVFMLLTYTALYVTVLSYVDLYVQKGNVAPDNSEVWAYFRYYYFRLLGSSLLWTIILVIAFVLLVIPAIYLWPIMVLFMPVMVMENTSFDKGMSRSFKLLKGQWWASAGTLLVSFLITAATSLVVSVPNSFLNILNTFSPESRGGSNLTIILSSILQHLPALFSVIPIITSALLYYSLVEKQENAGLLDRIDKFGEEPL